jgi:hypothetical protein
MTEFKTFTGTPSELGAELYIEFLMPVIRQVSARMSPDQLAQLYGGFMGAAFGSMAADFGQPNALHIIEVVAARFATFKPFEETH